MKTIALYGAMPNRIIPAGCPCSGLLLITRRLRAASSRIERQELGTFIVWSLFEEEQQSAWQYGVTLAWIRSRGVEKCQGKLLM